MLPLLSFADSLAHDPSADLYDLAGLFRERDEFSWWQQAPGRMGPANQRFDPRDLLGLQADDRLIVEYELLVGNGTIEVALDAQPVDSLVMHAGLENGPAAAAGGLS